MTIFKKPQNPSEGIRLAFYGVLLSIIFGIGSMVYYNVAKDLYQSRIEQAGQRHDQGIYGYRQGIFLEAL